MDHKGVQVHYKPITDKKKQYWIYFRLSEIYNGYNLSSDTPLDSHALRRYLGAILIEMGVHIQDWYQVQIGRLDVFRNLQLNYEYEDYFHLVQLAGFKRTDFWQVEDSHYSGNRIIELNAYNKQSQLRSKNIIVNDSILRIELRFLNSHKIKEVFGTNNFYTIRDMIEGAYHIYIREAFGFLREMEAISKLVSPDCKGLREALFIYYASLNKRNINRIVKESITLLQENKYPKAERKNSKRVRSKKDDAERKRIERKSSNSEDYYKSALLIRDYLSGRKELALELIEALFNTPAKVAKFPFELIRRRFVTEQTQEALDKQFGIGKVKSTL
ncbi:hypothetical protein [Leptospira sp. id769339]|uniref:hypothetical protein n=1 Tax=Leptospira sp. id769339 TaxID=2864221 RepID=UPI00214C3B0F|nr:hypothetical protein [Leptospira sp. id769339]MCR1795780.1 hypothetical protein [Leptospira sp. id769339]